MAFSQSAIVQLHQAVCESAQAQTEADEQSSPLIEQALLHSSRAIWELLAQLYSVQCCRDVCCPMFLCASTEWPRQGRSTPLLSFRESSPPCHSSLRTPSLSAGKLQLTTSSDSMVDSTIQRRTSLGSGGRQPSKPPSHSRTSPQILRKRNPVAISTVGQLKRRWRHQGRTTFGK